MTPQSFQIILEEVASLYQVTPEMILSVSRLVPSVDARLACYWICRYAHHPQPSFPMIARYMKRKDHTTVLHGCDAVDQNMKTNRWLRENLMSLRERLLYLSYPPVRCVDFNTVPRSQFVMDGALEVSITLE